MIREIFGKKIGMTEIFDDKGDLVCVTLVEVEPACILEKIDYPKKAKAKIGCFKLTDKKAARIKKPVAGYFGKLGISPYKLVREVDIGEGEIETKKEVGVEIFNEGDTVDIQGKTKGKGFAGGMKRHGWSGQPGSHGSTTHRRIGSAGASAYPSKIIKGLNMPGHMGNVNRTTKNVKVVKVDADKQLLFIKGAVPGSRGTVLKIKKVS
jgi:large subunit ribosomal protein L3